MYDVQRKERELEEAMAQLSPEGRKFWEWWEVLTQEEEGEEPEKAEVSQEEEELWRELREFLQKGEAMYTALPEEDRRIIEQAQEMQKALGEAELDRQTREMWGGGLAEWLMREMQQQGLRRGLNREKRKKATLNELFDLQDKDEEE